MIKYKKIIKIMAVFQLCVGSLSTLGIFMGVMLPYLGVIESGKVFSVDPKYKEETYRVFDKYFPEYKTRNDFWDRFDEYEVYDFKVGESGFSFCVDKDYTIWGIRLEDRKEDTKRFSYFFEDGSITVYQNSVTPVCDNGEVKFDNGFSDNEEEIKSIIENQDE